MNLIHQVVNYLIENYNNKASTGVFHLFLNNIFRVSRVTINLLHSRKCWVDIRQRSVYEIVIQM